MSANMGEKERITKAAGKMSFATLISRILGYVKDMILAFYFGATGISDAFFASFRITNFLRVHPVGADPRQPSEPGPLPGARGQCPGHRLVVDQQWNPDLLGDSLELGASDQHGRGIHWVGAVLDPAPCITRLHRHSRSVRETLGLS